MMRRAGSSAERVSLLVLLLASLVLVVLIVRPFAGALFMGAVLAVAFRQVCRRLSAMLGGNRAAAATLVTLGLALAIVLPLATVSVVALRETVTGLDTLHQTLAHEGVEGLLHRTPQPIEPALERLWNWLPAAERNPQFIFDLEGRAAAALPSMAQAAGQMLVQATLMMIALFFLLLEGDRVIVWLNQISPLQKNQLKELLIEFRSVSRTVVFGTVVTAAAQAAVALVGYCFAHAPNPIFLTVLTFVLALVPMLGAGGFSFAVAVTLFLSGHPSSAIFLAIWSLLVVGLVDNVLKPLLIKGGIEIHGGIVFFSLAGGLAAFGPAGLVLGPMSVTFLLAILRIYRRDVGPGLRVRAAA